MIQTLEAPLVTQHGIPKTAATVTDAHSDEPLDADTDSIWNMNSWASVNEAMPTPRRVRRSLHLSFVRLLPHKHRSRKGISPWGVSVLVGTFVGMVVILLGVATLTSAISWF
ncbi:hypothetical protein [Bifidobacterium sp. ESL0732]|uniref:hypothetical protein n=1 Tax=Bifidobacterium sp. ESL0732 TaxID=2983222 RepID=UPI0023F70671|nr:hypothetical protein [Bifidobacterium sp. ESL0732]WEV64463.1 hypothetical protein OZX70_02440 [Bifidobacterium sp. ESL0732]